MKYIFLILFCPAFLFAQEGHITPELTKTDYGDYLISNFENIHGYVLHAKYPDSLKIEWSDSDSILMVLNSHDSVLFKWEENVLDFGDTGMGLDTLSLGEFGQLLVVQSASYPSYGDCNHDIRIFGFNKNGRFISLTGYINDCLRSTRKLKWLKIENGISLGAFDKQNENANLVPHLEITKFIGYDNISVVSYYKLHFDNGLNDSEIKDYNETLSSIRPIYYNGSEYYRFELSEDEIKDRQVKIYNQPNSNDSKSIKFKKKNVVKFSYLTEVKKIKWVYLRVNGIEGYIKLDDFDKLKIETADYE